MATTHSTFFPWALFLRFFVLVIKGRVLNYSLHVFELQDYLTVTIGNFILWHSLDIINICLVGKKCTHCWFFKKPKHTFQTHLRHSNFFKHTFQTHLRHLNFCKHIFETHFLPTNVGPISSFGEKIVLETMVMDGCYRKLI